MVCADHPRHQRQPAGHVLERPGAGGSWPLTHAPPRRRNKQVFEDRIRAAMPSPPTRSSIASARPAAGALTRSLRRARRAKASSREDPDHVHATVSRLGLDRRTRDGSIFREAELPTTFSPTHRPTRQLSCSELSIQSALPEVPPAGCLRRTGAESGDDQQLERPVSPRILDPPSGTCRSSSRSETLRTMASHARLRSARSPHVDAAHCSCVVKPA